MTDAQLNPNYVHSNGITTGQLMNAVSWWELALRSHNLRLPVQRHYTEEYCKQFGNILMLAIMDDPDILRHGIVNEYQPVGVLRDAALKVGIDVGTLSPFPWKTRMTFLDGSIHVQFGDGAPWFEYMHAT